MHAGKAPLYLEDTPEARPGFTAGRMFETVEGSGLARDLLRDGVVPLTDDAARQYVIGLGVDPANADAAVARLMSGGATLLTEIVRDGQVERFAGRPEAERAPKIQGEISENVGSVSEEGTFTNAIDRMLSGMPPNHPLWLLLDSLGTELGDLRRSKRLRPLAEP